MRTVEILEKDDRVLMTDWCRPLSLCTMSDGHSDSMSFKSNYAGTPENNAKWCPVGAIFGSLWENSTVEAFNKIGKHYEFVRGDIPKSHHLDMRDYTDLRTILNKPSYNDYDGSLF